MLIDKVSIQNYRCLEKIEISFLQLTGLIGRNGTGKSSILKAVDLFFHPNDQSLIQKNDFFNHDITNAIEIKVVFHQIKTYELNEKLQNIADENDGTLPIKCVIEWNDKNNEAFMNYYINTNGIAEFEAIINDATLNKTNCRKKLQEIIDSNAKYSEIRKERACDKQINVIREFEQENLSLCEPVSEDARELVYSMSESGHTKFVFIPAFIDISQSSKEKSIIKNVFDNLVESVRKSQDLEEILDRHQKDIEKYYQQIQPEIDTLFDQITKVTQEYLPHTKIIPKSPTVDRPHRQSASLDYEVQTEGFSTDLLYKGSGTQRSFLMSLIEFQSTINYRRTHQDNELDESEDAKLDLIFLIEEPELYMHPTRCRFLFTKFQELTQNANNQIIYCTHNPHFVDLQLFEQICLLKKDFCERGSPLKSTIPTQVTFSDFKQKWHELTKTPLQKINRISLLGHSHSKTFKVHNEGFFADFIVLVEGDSDKVYLWETMKNMGYNWDDENIVIINCYGKYNLKKIYSVFHMFNLPIFLLFDADDHNKGTKEDGKTKKENQILFHMVEPDKTYPDFPKTEIYSTWAVFHDDIESEITDFLNSRQPNHFENICTEIGNNFGKLGDKNAYKAYLIFQKIRETYPKGIPALNDIVEQISRTKKEICF